MNTPQIKNLLLYFSSVLLSKDLETIFICKIRFIHPEQHKDQQHSLGSPKPQKTGPILENKLSPAIK